MKKLLPVILFLLLSYSGIAQCMLFPVSLNERITSSAFIIEGRVVGSTSYWNKEQNNIYTLHQILAYKFFKGDLGANTRTFFVVTEGGRVGNTRQHVTSTLELEIGTTGVFFCNPSRIDFGDENITGMYKRFEAYAGPQGLVEFEKNMKWATDPFNRYQINPQLYNTIIDLTGEKPVIAGDYENEIPVTAASPAISSFSPDTVTAGTLTVLTINGSNFGATQGSSFVAFRDPDNGGTGIQQPVAMEYVSWSDNQIKVKVPTKAGTGKITVDNGSGSIQSSANLIVNFAMLNVKDGNNIVSQPVHIGDNGNGGYTWQFYTGFNTNSAAKQSFLRAFQNWRCGTLINWDIGTTTTINTIARDNVQVIRFDIGSELPNGVLGRCSSWWSGCGASPNTVWYVDELDIVFDDGTNWNFGPGNPTFSQYDFESVALHELGHGHQLGHVINSNEVMHYSIANSEKKRVLSNKGDLSGGNYVMGLSTANSVCSKAKLTALNPAFCSLIPVANFKQSQSTVCPNVIITFTDSSGGSTNSFNWDFGADATPPAATGKGPHPVTYSTPGGKTVRLIVGGVITNDTITKTNTVTVLPGKPAIPASITGPDTGCLKAQVYTTDSVQDATQYTWGITGGGNTNGSKDTTVTTTFFSPATAHTVWVKASNSCGASDSVVKSVNVVSNPVAGFTFVIKNDTIFLTNTSTGAGTNTWKFGNGQTAAFQNLSLVPAQSGTYAVTLVVSNFCGVDSTSKNIGFVKSSIGPINKIGFSIYPNPVSGGTATVSVENMAENLRVELFDIAGRLLKETLISNQQTQLNLENLASGVYLYKVYNSTETLATGRLVVK